MKCERCHIPMVRLAYIADDDYLIMSDSVKLGDDETWMSLQACPKCGSVAVDVSRIPQQPATGDENDE